jgi:hypothetical protein
MSLSFFKPANFRPLDVVLLYRQWIWPTAAFAVGNDQPGGSWGLLSKQTWFCAWLHSIMWSKRESSLYILCQRSSGFKRKTQVGFRPWLVTLVSSLNGSIKVSGLQNRPRLLQARKHVFHCHGGTVLPWQEDQGGSDPSGIMEEYFKRHPMANMFSHLTTGTTGFGLGQGSCNPTL